jgi:hypothetical protein
MTILMFFFKFIIEDFQKGRSETILAADCMEQGLLDAQYLRHLRNFPPFMKQQVNVRDFIIEAD